MTTLDLEPIKARLDKAHTEWGPWKAKEDSWDGYSVVIDDNGPGVSIVAEQIGQGEDGGRGDAEMIAHAPEDIAALISEVERLRAERDGDGDVESGTLWHAQRDVSRLRNELHQIEALRRKAEIRCESLEAQIDAVDGLHRKTPVYDTFADDCEEHDPEEHAIEGLDSSVAGPSTVSSIDW